MARHPKGTTPALSEELIEKLASTIRAGAYVETAAAFCGISKDTFYRWLRLAESDQATELLMELSDAVKKAMAEAELRDLSVIDKAAQGGVWQAAAWRLERKHNARWGRQTKLQLEHSGLDSKADQAARASEDNPHSAHNHPVTTIQSERTDRIRKILTNPDTLAALEALESSLDKEVL